MIRVSVLYPNSQGASFDMEYYLKTHLPMVRKTLRAALLKDEAWKGLGAPGDQPATYQVVFHMCLGRRPNRATAGAVGRRYSAMVR